MDGKEFTYSLQQTLNLVGPTVITFINTLSPGATLTGLAPNVAGLPGPTLAILALLCAALAAVLLLSTLCCTGLTSLPGFGAHCRVVCDEAGLIGREMFAVDGVKMPSNASKTWSGTREDFGKKVQKMERAVRQSLTMSQGDPTILVDRPLTAAQIDAIDARISSRQR